MSEKFQNKYRNGTFRAQWWDYGWNAAYFITICTQSREHFFGHIENCKMILSKTGEIAATLWNDIPYHHQFVELGEFVIMPNHIHGILIINKPNMVGSEQSNPAGSGQSNPVGSGQSNPVGSGHALILPGPGTKRFQNIGKNTVSSMVLSYKSAVTKYANRLGYPNGWQKLFHERIIRNDKEFQRITNYIIANPQKWDENSK